MQNPLLDFDLGESSDDSDFRIEDHKDSGDDSINSNDDSGKYVFPVIIFSLFNV